MLLDTFPVRLKEWHTFDCSSVMLPSLSSSSSSLASSALLGQGYLFAYVEVFLNILNEYTTYQYCIGKHSSLSLSSSTKASAPSSTTSTFSLDEIRCELETEHGFTMEEIPVILGGCWTYDVFDAWFRERMYYERNRYFAGDHFDVGKLQDD